MEGVHDMSPGYLCGVCNQQCKNHKGLKVHMKKFHSHSQIMFMFLKISYVDLLVYKMVKINTDVETE